MSVEEILNKLFIKNWQDILDTVSLPIIILNNRNFEYLWFNKLCKEIMEYINFDFSYFIKDYIKDGDKNLEISKENLDLNLVLRSNFIKDISNNRANAKKTVLGNKIYYINVLNLDDLSVVILNPVIDDYFDNETNLLNYNGFLIKFELIASLAYRSKKKLFIAIADIDKFENILRSYYYPEIIKITNKLGMQLKNSIRENIDIVARLDASRFIFSLFDIKDNKTLLKTLERIQKNIIENVSLNFSEILTISIISAEYISPSQKSVEIINNLENYLNDLIMKLNQKKYFKSNFIEIL